MQRLVCVIWEDYYVENESESMLEFKKWLRTAALFVYSFLDFEGMYKKEPRDVPNTNNLDSRPCKKAMPTTFVEQQSLETS